MNEGSEVKKLRAFNKELSNTVSKLQGDVRVAMERQYKAEQAQAHLVDEVKAERLRVDTLIHVLSALAKKS